MPTAEAAKLATCRTAPATADASDRTAEDMAFTAARDADAAAVASDWIPVFAMETVAVMAAPTARGIAMNADINAPAILPGRAFNVLITPIRRMIERIGIITASASRRN